MIESKKTHSISFKPSPIISEVHDEVALDEPMCIFVNGDYHATLIATPDMRKELAVGYLHGEDIIESASDIRSINVRGGDVHLELKKAIDLREAAVGMMNLIVTSCGSRPSASTPPQNLPRVESQLQVEAERVLLMLSDLNRRNHIHLRTGGSHAAMLCSSNGDVLAFAEDVGRHNAVDKVIGSLLLRKGNLEEGVLVSTGRLSGDIVLKAARGRIPIVVSMTVPLASGVRLAEESGVTLVSLRRSCLKVYTHPQRIKVNSGSVTK
jgi:FdhD protein